MTSTDYEVFCADIGSIAKKSFGWASAHSSGADVKKHHDIRELVVEVANALTLGRKVALGFECPLFVPLPGDPNRLTAAREGEGSHPWSAGAGCGALATGLTESAWILIEIRARFAGVVPAFLNWRRFQASPSGLFVWEAFVTGEAKAASHSNDAAVAVGEFCRVSADLDGANAIKADRVFSLIGASLLRSGWACDLGILSEPCIVIKPLTRQHLDGAGD
ncbi:MAG: hypothetical protein ABI565_10120 [Vicinamibacteria bacterium]